MIVLSVHTRVDSSDSPIEPKVSPSVDVPRTTACEALNTILLKSPGNPSMWLFK